MAYTCLDRCNGRLYFNTKWRKYKRNIEKVKSYGTIKIIDEVFSKKYVRSEGRYFMQRRICPICDHPIKYGHYCSFCKQWIRNPNYVNATYYLNERHPAHETDCEYHNAGSASWETSARAGTDAIRTLADRAKAYSQTQKAAGAGRQASVRTQNQNSMSYQTTQRRSAVQQGKNQKKKGKMSLVLVILLILFALSGINYLYRMFMYFIWFL